jgi:hypothetical protein
MAEGQSMTVADVVEGVLAGEHGDFVREAVAIVGRELMEAEVSAEIGAAHGEVSVERVTHRNGYRPRLWETRVGEVELLVPRKRSGAAYFPSFVEPRRRSEQAIVAVVLEAYVNGVSTRKVDRRRAARHPGDVQGSSQPALQAARRTGGGVSLPPARGRLPLPVAGRETGQGARPGPRALEGACDRLRGPRVGGARGARARPRRGRIGCLLGRVPALAALARAPARSPPSRSRSSSSTRTSAKKSERRYESSSRPEQPLPSPTNPRYTTKRYLTFLVLPRRTHNPKVAGSNPAPAIGKPPQMRGLSTSRTRQRVSILSPGHRLGQHPAGPLPGCQGAPGGPGGRRFESGRSPSEPLARAGFSRRASRNRDCARPIRLPSIARDGSSSAWMSRPSNIASSRPAASSPARSSPSPRIAATAGRVR